MFDKALRLRHLIQMKAQGDISADEQKELDDFIDRSQGNADLVSLLTADDGLELARALEIERKKAWMLIEPRFPAAFEIRHYKPRSYRINYLRYAAAAAILFLVIGSIYYFLRPSHSISEQKMVATNQRQPDAPPGGRRAVLTLADQSTILLDSSAAGTIAQQGNISIRKSENGTIQYIGSGKKLNTGLNTLETPNGGDYVLLLEDGTRCIINAGSKLRYPAAFTATERKVFLSGEAYFEVAKNSAKPFLVETDNGTTIRVTGTKFNINAYDNEPVERTSLLEGSVIVTSKTAERKLVPGDEATFNKKGYKLTVSQTNVNASVYWTKGYFYFSKAPLKEVMRQIARWYDVQVDFVDNVGDDRRIQGGLSRNIPLSEVLTLLKKYEPNIEYAMQNNKVLKIYRSKR
ncbi:FecR domain-containing protein [Paraflavitalea sp. CAU 1676]|uniref:FecR family protein n=1 Tax=Paraflavitalea sp. CAU 1676 TaxID=3032598 RepID=UPI0023DA38FE|nr:FecR domain-containing protein [Paraflavitalea sp. CAU 1676]MDF2191233.1 FecR domain-containing protein [Paraflavitalea sp. CAU 1676]